MANASVRIFKQALRDLSDRAKARLPARVMNEAEALAAAMQNEASAHSRSGATVQSIKAVPTNKPNRARVVAGGDLTSKEVRKGSGVTYDYVRADEFGTVKMSAIPFFFSTYRARKAGIKQRIAEGIASDITS
jgi:HK97 gp10 family phage protein